jgi:NAD(P)-dependent dehydrogenase (short-subunit alcohol dehydrogenase family)
LDCFGKALAHIEELIPFGREIFQEGGALGQPEDVAELVLYLASDASRLVNGAELVIDGGVVAS